MGPITDEHKLTYQRNVALVVQQMRSLFESAFSYQSNLAGKRAQILDLIGKAKTNKNGSRGGDTPNIDVPTEPVWCKPDQYDTGYLFEKEDIIKALTDFQSPFVQSFGAAMARDPDIGTFAPALFGTRLIGEDGTTSQAWDSTNKVVTVGVGYSTTDDTTATGMNVKKIIRGLRLWQALKVDIQMEDKWMALDAQGVEELYRDITYINKDYRDKAVLEGKQVREILDVKIIPYEDLPDYDGSTRTAAMWCKSGMHWGEFSPLEITIGPNIAKKNRTQLYMEKWVGATRSEDAKVLKVLNKK